MTVVDQMLLIRINLIVSAVKSPDGLVEVVSLQVVEGDAEAVALDLGLFAVGGLVAKDRNDHLEDEACFNRLVLVAKQPQFYF